MSWRTDFVHPASTLLSSQDAFEVNSLDNYSNFKQSPLKKPESDFKIKYKTERCKNWEAGICEFGHRCAFAHGDSELRDRGQTTKNYKTKRCKQFFELGYCIYGYRCQFKHKEHSPDVSISIPTNAFIENMSNKRLSIFKELESRSN